MLKVIVNNMTNEDKEVRALADILWEKWTNKKKRRKQQHNPHKPKREA